MSIEVKIDTNPWIFFRDNVVYLFDVIDDEAAGIVNSCQSGIDENSTYLKSEFESITRKCYNIMREVWKVVQKGAPPVKECGIFFSSPTDNHFVVYKIFETIGFKIKDNNEDGVKSLMPRENCYELLNKSVSIIKSIYK